MTGIYPKPTRRCACGAPLRTQACGRCIKCADRLVDASKRLLTAHKITALRSKGLAHMDTVKRRFVAIPKEQP